MIIAAIFVIIVIVVITVISYLLHLFVKSREYFTSYTLHDIIFNYLKYTVSTCVLLGLKYKDSKYHLPAEIVSFICKPGTKFPLTTGGAVSRDAYNASLSQSKTTHRANCQTLYTYCMNIFTSIRPIMETDEDIKRFMIYDLAIWPIILINKIRTIPVCTDKDSQCQPCREDDINYIKQQFPDYWGILQDYTNTTANDISLDLKKISLTRDIELTSSPIPQKDLHALHMFMSTLIIKPVLCCLPFME